MGQFEQLMENPGSGHYSQQSACATVQPSYNMNMYFYIAPIIEWLKMVTLCSMS